METGASATAAAAAAARPPTGGPTSPDNPVMIRIPSSFSEHFLAAHRATAAARATLHSTASAPAASQGEAFAPRVMTRFACRRQAEEAASVAAAASPESAVASSTSVAAAASSTTTAAASMPRRTPRNNAGRKRKAADAPSPAPKKRPGRLKRDPDAPPEDDNCCICMEEPDVADLASISGCQHLFCFQCIEKWADRENKCPLCKERFTKIDRVHKPKRQSGKRSSVKSTKKVRNRDQRSDSAMTALESLFGDRGGLSLSDFLHSRVPSHHLARIIISSMASRGSGGSSSRAFAASSGAFFRSRTVESSSSASASSSRLEDSLFSSDDGSDDDDAAFGSFVAQIRGMDGPVGVMRVTRTITTTRTGSSPPVPVLPPISRTYATNLHTPNAGVSAETPLEIDDSDDDDEVEVVQVTRPARG